MKSNLDEIECFIAIADTGSIAKASEQLHRSNSSMSRALKRLEQKLGVALFVRTTRNIRLTQEGNTFLHKARHMLAEFAALEESLLREAVEVSGVIRVNSATTFTVQVLAPLVHRFMQRYPQIEVELFNDDRNINLLEERTDVAIRFGELKDSSLHAKLLYRSRFYIVASPDYIARCGKPKTVDELLRHELLGFAQMPQYNRWPIIHNGEALLVSPRLRVSSGVTLRELALLGNGIARLSSYEVLDDIQAGRLVPILEEQNTKEAQLIHALYYQNTHLPLRVRLFIDYLSDALAAYC